jgi:hypothetical protein
MKLNHTVIAFVFLFSFLSRAGGQESAKPNNLGSTVIAGHVLALDKPFAGATVTIWYGFDEPTPNTTVATAKTDESGAYKLTVAPGNYKMWVTAPGFISGHENNVFINIKRVTVVGDHEIPPIDFSLIREGIIRGTVTDADGKPLPHLPIMIVPEKPWIGTPQYSRDLRTDDQGNYRIIGLPEGRYRVAAGFYPLTTATLFRRVGYRRTFYGGTPEESQAKVIEVTSGADVKIDLNVGPPVKTFTVRAKIVDDQSGKPIQDMGYHINVFENGKPVGGAGTNGRSNNEGEMVIENFPPGEYSITVPDNNPLRPVSGELPLTPNIFGESKHFTVIDGDVNGIEIRAIKAATLSGFIAIEGAKAADIRAKLSQIRVVGMMIMSPLMTASVKPDGSFTFSGLKTGKLQFSFYGPPPGNEEPLLRFVRIEHNGVTLPQGMVVSEGIDVHPGEQITGVRLVLAYANSRIHGTLKGALSPNWSSQATAWQNGKRVAYGDLDAHGEFVLLHLSAGEYKIVVEAKDANGNQRKLEKQVKVDDDSITEVTLDLNTDNTTNQNPPQ